MSFGSGSTLDVDHAASFGLGVGTGNYTGPLLENFGVAAAVSPFGSGLLQTGSGGILGIVTTLLGLGVGTGSYTGPPPAIDLKDFAVAGAALNFDPANGLLQLTNSSVQTATLDFQVATLGSGTFHAVSDGGTGLLLTRS
jgi:hypothetical protein